METQSRGALAPCKQSLLIAQGVQKTRWKKDSLGTQVEAIFIV